MAKHKSGRALFEILAKERREEAARRSPQATPEPIVRRYGAGRETEAGSRRPTERPVQRTAPKRGGERRISLTYYHLAIAMVLVACAGMILFVLGTRFGRPRLPQTEARPTMEEVLKAPSAPGLVMPRPGATEEGAEEEAETGAPEDRPAARRTGGPVSPPHRAAVGVAIGIHRQAPGAALTKRRRDGPGSPGRIVHPVQPCALCGPGPGPGGPIRQGRRGKGESIRKKGQRPPERVRAEDGLASRDESILRRDHRGVAECRWTRA